MEKEVGEKMTGRDQDHLAGFIWQEWSLHLFREFHGPDVLNFKQFLKCSSKNETFSLKYYDDGKGGNNHPAILTVLTNMKQL